MEPTTLGQRATTGETRPLAAEAFAFLALASLDPLRQFMELRRKSSGPFALERPIDEREWLGFYRYRTLEVRLAEQLLGEHAEPLLAIMRAFRNPHAASDEERETAFAAILLAFASESSPLLQSLAEAAESDELDEDWSLKAAESSAMQFALRVAVPCWCAYGKLPGDLLWDAWSGREDVAERAVRNLLRLDPRVAAHPHLIRWMQRDPRVTSFRAKKVARWKRSKTAFDKPKSETHYAKVVLGYVSEVSRLLDCPMLTPDLTCLLREIRVELPDELPDGLAADLLGRSQETLRREIGRKRGFFKLPSRPDRSTYERVRFTLAEAERRSGHGNQATEHARPGRRPAAGDAQPARSGGRGGCFQ